MRCALLLARRLAGSARRSVAGGFLAAAAGGPGWGAAALGADVDSKQLSEPIVLVPYCHRRRWLSSHCAAP